MEDTALAGQRWSIRQTGVFHRYSTGRSNAGAVSDNSWILLNPMVDSKIFTRIQQSVDAGLNLDELERDPLRLHILALSTHVDNWRQYIHDLCRELLPLVRLQNA